MRLQTLLMTGLLLGVILFAMASIGCSNTSSEAADTAKGSDSMAFEIRKSNEELKKQLTAEQYRVTQEKGTERPGTGQYLYNKETGVYDCVVCGNPLFTSDTKFDSGCGWPSFYKPIDSTSIREFTDKSLGMTRTEIVCGKCGSHLGHVFDDGPYPTGLRYCINSVSLDFSKKSDSGDKARTPESKK